MLAKLWDLIIGNFCGHKWKIIYRERLTRNGKPEEPAYGIRYTLSCEKCGNIKWRE